MTSTYTTNKGLELPGYNDYVDTWNVPVNADFTLVDTAFGGSTLLNVTSVAGDVTLTATQYRPPQLIISGTLTANVRFLIPAGVGGQTDLEQKELYDRVDDAVCAVRSALEEGILPGAGKALLDESVDIEGPSDSREYDAAMSIMRNALMAPFQQILANAGLKPSDVYKDGTPIGHGYNLKTGQMGDLVEMGVIDPLKVTRSALQNAVSVAVTILSTNAIITMARTYEQQQ